ncbi:MAG: hypothetical protein Q7T03_06580 [Deltaproteobacteria bacterium]|nr:hypothetical protein [Deltaproteobacteria bacterium]
MTQRQSKNHARLVIAGTANSVAEGPRPPEAGPPLAESNPDNTKKRPKRST